MARGEHPEITTLARMIACPTVSDRPMVELAAYVAQRAEDQGFRVTLYEDDVEAGKANVVCEAGPEGVPGGVTLSGHLDVVPVEGQSWASDPFVLTERDGKLFGRGTADMKGFIAATIEALERVKIASLTRPLALVWTYDEEVGCHGSAKLTQRLRDAGRALPDEALIGEPTDFQVLRMHPGHVTLVIRTAGASAHSSKPDLGASAIKAMGRVLLMLEDLEQELIGERRFEGVLERPWVTMNAGMLKGGAAVNMVPDQCELKMGYRPLPGDDPLDVARRVERRLAALPLPAGTRAEVEVLRRTPSLLTPPGLPLEGLLTQHADHAEVGACPFATDGGNLAALGVRSLIFGPGSINVAHKPDEHVECGALARAVNIVEAVVSARCLG